MNEQDGLDAGVDVVEMETADGMICERKSLNGKVIAWGRWKDKLRKMNNSKQRCYGFPVNLVSLALMNDWPSGRQLPENHLQRGLLGVEIIGKQTTK